MIELHRLERHSFDNNGEVLVNTAEIAFIARHYKPGTDISEGTTICFRNPAGPPGSAWGITLAVLEDYDRVKALWLADKPPKPPWEETLTSQ